LSQKLREVLYLKKKKLKKETKKKINKNIIIRIIKEDLIEIAIIEE